ncbi:MAG TPA: GFA family protein [Rhizomicrobium sp.]|nr:GFA family protein [Rhizomicrobium sp.]
MVSPFSGGCLCGAVRYEAAGEPIAVMECHCRDCQKAGGGASMVGVILPRGTFRITAGAPKAHAVKTDAGGLLTRYFCATCGSPIYHEPDSMPITVVKAGSMDDPSWIEIGAAIYVCSALPWAHIDHSLPCHEKMPPRAS